MIVTFTPTPKSRPPMRTYYSAELACDTAGDYEVPEELGKQICADFPDNFRAGGGERSVSKPDHNRAAPPPGKNK